MNKLLEIIRKEEAQNKLASMENLNLLEIILIDEKHPIFLTEEEVEEFNRAASARDDNKYVEMSMTECILFCAQNTGIYYQGKLWGFNDTDVRDKICTILEKVS